MRLGNVKGKAGAEAQKETEAARKRGCCWDEEGARVRATGLVTSSATLKLGRN